VLERVEQDRRDEAAVLADFREHGIGCPGEHDVLRDAFDLDRLALPAEHELVDLRLPRPEPRARPCAARAALLAVAAVVGAPPFLELEGLVDAVLVVVAEDVVRTHDDASCAPGAQPARHDFLVELFPLELLGRHQRSCVGEQRFCHSTATRAKRQRA